MTLPVEAVVARLAGVKKQGNGYIARRPAHEDSVQSLSISTGEDDRALVKCHAGCELASVLAAAGLETANLFVRRPQREAVLAEYPYVDEAGDTLFVVERRVPKKFIQKRPEGDGWVYNLNGTRRVPYRLPELLGGVAAGEWVLIVEGEKDAEALVGRGFVATCNAGGAGK
jgi:hypothetical protein